MNLSLFLTLFHVLVIHSLVIQRQSSNDTLSQPKSAITHDPGTNYPLSICSADANNLWQGTTIQQRCLLLPHLLTPATAALAERDSILHPRQYATCAIISSVTFSTGWAEGNTATINIPAAQMYTFEVACNVAVQSIIAWTSNGHGGFTQVANIQNSNTLGLAPNDQLSVHFEVTFGQPPSDGSLTSGTMTLYRYGN